MKTLKKLRTLGYLPGGEDKYIETLIKCLQFIQKSTPSEEQLELFFNTFGVESQRVVQSCINTMKNLELIARSNRTFTLSTTAKEFLQTQNNNLILQKLNSNYDGIKEILEMLSEEDHMIHEIFVNLKEKINVKWRTEQQVKIRLNWLRSLGLVAKIGQKYRLLKEAKGVESEIEQERPSHSEVQDMLVDIGKALGCDAQKEYPIKNGKLDVLWTTDGQKMAWEVHFEANLHQALSNLADARVELNAEPRLVTTQEGESKAKKLIEPSFEGLNDTLVIEHWKKIIEWHQSCRGNIEMLKKLGIKFRPRFRKTAHRIR